jgi:hypothetical protein
MSYDFIFENVYFSGIMLFQVCYMYFPQMRSNVWFLPLEVIGVFLPYYTVRNFFPKSSFRDSIREGNKYASFVKFFYVGAKHFNGYYPSYLNFLGLLGKSPIDEWQMMRSMFIVGGWGTTIAMFLQTLKFKKYISHFTAMALYIGCFPFFWVINVALFYIATDHVWLTTLTCLGIWANFQSRKVQIAYQVFMAALLTAIRYDIVPLATIASMGGLVSSVRTEL